MLSTVRSLTLAGALLATGTAGSATLDYVAGLDAFEIADYRTAHERWLACAEQEDLRCEYALGVLFNEAKGVEADHAAAARWFRKAAAHGSRDAQLELGIMRSIGQPGVEQDAVQAYVWFSLAAADGDETADNHRHRVESLLFPEERAEAQRRIKAWKAGIRGSELTP